MEKGRTSWRQRVHSFLVLAMLSVIGLFGVLLVAYGGTTVRPF
ncbi:MAG: hypothetical protein M0Z66_08395 [Thermaerobacter sp.]|nr:hypothetical protein [Thermaerobacter sp.]